MRTTIKSTNIEATDALREYIELKFSPLDRLVGSFEQEGEIVLNIEVARTTNHHKKGEVYYVEVTATVNGKTLRIEQNDDEMRKAIDSAKDRFKMEIQRFKERAQDKRA